ncbi:MAG: ADP-ribosylglycohydrolase [Verrucomicrobiales bacterium]|nr:ADP-ribosylglycohydrolase [Verrucomicrobiales bacterium]
MIQITTRDRIRGLLLGTAVGDALGLPAEGLSRARIQRRWGNKWKMRLFFGYGMVSDDTEHSLMVAQSLVAFPKDSHAFQRRLGWKLRWWVLALPAGVGLATAKASLKLWCGFSPAHSGVRSAGNGAAMRVGVIGAVFANDLIQRRKFTRAATQLTHTDVRAEIGAIAVVEAVAWIIRAEKPFEEFLPTLGDLTENEEWRALCRKLVDAKSRNLTVNEFADALGLERGVTGYVFHTVPIALYACAQHPHNFHDALSAALTCGGDTDTVGAIVGCLMGAQVGSAGVPSEWVNHIIEWPRSLSFLERVSDQVVLASEGTSAKEVSLFWPGIIPRNIFFLVIILSHGFRRLLPPYCKKT